MKGICSILIWSHCSSADSSGHNVDRHWLHGQCKFTVESLYFIPVTSLIRRTFNYRSHESLVHIPCMYRSLTKECTCLEHLTSLPKSCGGRYSFECFHIYNHERVPMSCVTVTQCPWSKWLDKEQSYLWLQSRVLMAQNTLNGITSPWAWCSSWWVPH